MKRIKLITPLTLCALSTMVMPLVSCNREKPEEGFIYWTKGETYVPLTPMDSDEYGSCEEATQKYQYKVKTIENKIIADDFVYRVSLGDLSKLKGDITFNVDKIGYKLTDLGDITRRTDTGEWFFRVSFKIKLTAVAKAKSFTTKESEITYQSASIEFSKMPLQCWYTSSYPHIVITSCYEGSFKDDAEWSVKMPKFYYDSEDDVISISSEQATYNNRSIGELESEKLYGVVSSFVGAFVEFESNYFSKVTVTNPK